MRVVPGNDASFNMLTFGVPARETFDFLAQMGSNFNSAISDEAKFRFGEVKDFYKTLSYDDAINVLRSASEGVKSLELPNRIMPLLNLSDLQHAPDAMLPWIMAHPVLRETYSNNACEGYGDRLIDYYSDVLGESYPLYKAAVNGLRREVDDEYRMEVFAEVGSEESLQIDMNDQLAIMSTWNEIDHQLSLNDRDPTSKFNGKL